MFLQYERSTVIDSRSHTFTRRDFSVRFAALFPGFSFGAAALASPKPSFPVPEEISRSSEAIHQEVVFDATPARVYDALTDAKQFNKVVHLSAAMQSMGLSAKPVEMSRELGTSFSAFGGYVSGRQIELVPNQRIVQAWRAGGWDPGIYSIARFELSSSGSGTKLVFDHIGFPQGAAAHLLEGWKSNYWQPLAQLLAQPS